MARNGLDRTAVVRAAAKRADHDGLAQLTLTTVAADLGVQVPSLYKHVRGVDDLRQELAVVALREMSRYLSRATIGKAGDDAVFALADAYQQFAEDHSGLYDAMFLPGRRDNEEWMVTAVEVSSIVEATFSAYHLSGDDLLHADRAFRVIADGFALLTRAHGFRQPVDERETFRRLIEALIESILRRQSAGDLPDRSTARSSRSGEPTRRHSMR